jgi:hypothetical protein
MKKLIYIYIIRNDHNVCMITYYQFLLVHQPNRHFTYR